MREGGNEIKIKGEGVPGGTVTENKEPESSRARARHFLLNDA